MTSSRDIITILSNSFAGSESNEIKQSKLPNCGDNPKNRASLVASGFLSSITGSISTKKNFEKNQIYK